MEGDLMIGTCREMCPPSELGQHHSEHGLTNPFECDFKGHFQKSLAIKTHHRSFAGKETLPHEVRPLPVLIKTLNHIINYVIGQKMNTLPGTTEIDMYLFVRDRLRAIRSDITCQNLKGKETIKIFETSCLFFIWSGSRFYMYNQDTFDLKQNTDQIKQTLNSLLQLYDIYYQENQEMYPTESFFRALSLSTYLPNPDFMAKLMTFSTSVKTSDHVKTVIDLKSAMACQDIESFIQILNQAPIQLASYVLQNSKSFWEKIGISIRKIFSSRQFPISFLTDFLKVPSNYLKSWMQAFSLNPGNDKSMVSFNIKNPYNLTKLPSLIIPDQFLENSTFCDVIEFITKDINISKQKTIETTKTYEAVQLQKPEPIQQQIEEISEPEEQTIPVTVQLTTINEKQVQIQLNKHSLKRQNSLKKVSKKSKKEENIKISLNEIIAMLPYQLPPISSVVVYVQADDSSESSIFALDRFNFVDKINICEKLISSSCVSYLIITNNPQQKGISVILNCNEMNEIESKKPVVTFRKSGFNPVLTFKSCLRHSIKLGLLEIFPFNLSTLVSETISSVFDVITRSISWNVASANCVFSLMNLTLGFISSSFVSETMKEFLLPFDHHEFDFKELKRFADKLKTLRFDFLDDFTSRKKIVGSSWPNIISKQFELAIPQFVVPVTSQFDRSTFINHILDQLPIREPSETVIQY